MNQTVINFLVNLKNASLKKKFFIVISANKKLLNLIKLFYKEGFIQSYSFVDNCKSIIIYFRYPLNINLFKNVKILSTPTKIIHLKYVDIIKILDNNKLLVLSLSNFKYVTSLTCKKLKIGGIACFTC